MRNYLTRKNDVITCVVGLSWERYKMIFFYYFFWFEYNTRNSSNDNQIFLLLWMLFIFSSSSRRLMKKRDFSALLRLCVFTISEIKIFRSTFFSLSSVKRKKKLKITKITTRVPHEWICIALEILQFHGLGI